jgi:hypothetical protein
MYLLNGARMVSTKLHTDSAQAEMFLVGHQSLSIPRIDLNASHLISQFDFKTKLAPTKFAFAMTIRQAYDK